MLLDDPYPTIYSEYAVFGDLTIHFTDAFDIQFGGRESENRQSYQETLTGPLFVLFGLPSPSINPLVHTKDNAFTYLVIPRLKLNEQLMLYARFASGYRPGGPNPTCILFSAPCHYEPDKTLNYEIGVKSDAFDHRLSVDASAYYIDWKNIQIQVSDPSTGGVYYTNASRAKSKGLELELRARPGAGLTLAAWAAWNDATLSSDLPTNSSAFGLAGDRLPYSARISGNVSVEEDFPLLGTATGYVAGSLSYTGERKDYFPASSQQSRLSLPGYAQTNLRAGVRYNSWAMSLFVNNVGDKRGILEYPISYATSFQTVTYIQPRTAGLSLSKTF
jgi:outer membrane receptor protein involved in Fe transport